MKKLSDSQKQKIKKALDQHAKFSKSYFWSNTDNASNRRQQEKANNWEVSFIHKGVEYRYISNLSISCRNFYYTGEFYRNGKRGNVRIFKNLLES